jgi:antitoxin PrlF
MQESTVTRRGRTTLPEEVRAALRLEPGDRVRHLVGDGEVRIVKVSPLAELAGLLARPGQAVVSLEEMDAAIASGAVAGSSRL